MSVEDWTEIVFAALTASIAVLGTGKLFPHPEQAVLRITVAAVFAASVMFILNLVFN